MEKNIIQLIAAFFGSMGFGMIFNIRFKNLILGSICGFLSWSMYLFAEQILGTGILLSAAAAAGTGQICAETLARIRKTPTTVFSIPAVVPLIPGGSLYRTMENAVFGNWDAFRSVGFDTLQTTFGIAIGTSFVAACFFVARQFQKKKA